MAEPAVVSYAPTEELQLIRSTARQYLDDHYASETVRDLMMSEDGFDRVAWKELADLGWLGLAIDAVHGGSGLGPVELGVLVEEMGRRVMPGPFFASAVLATYAIQHLGSADQQAGWLADLASGDTIATLAMFETPRGWDPGKSSTKAELDGESWVLSGQKRYVLDGHLADLLLVSARTDDGIGLFAIAPDANGLTVSQTPALDPTRRQATFDLDKVSAVRVGSGDATDHLRATQAFGAALLANEAVGGATVAMEMSVEYAKTRHQFGRPIGSYQSIKHRCAQMLMKVEHAKSVAHHAVRVADDPDEFAVASPLAASVAAEAYVWVSGENIQVHGGIGFTWEHDAHLYLKRAKSSSLLLGSPQHHRDQLGKAIGL